MIRTVRPFRPEAPTGYTFTGYRPELHAQVLDLQTYLWSPDRAVNAAYFEWKYERNPYLREPLIHLACRDGEVVAMRGFFGARWEAGRPGRAVDAPCAGDLVRGAGAPEARARSATDDVRPRGPCDARPRLGVQSERGPGDLLRVPPDRVADDHLAGAAGAAGRRGPLARIARLSGQSIRDARRRRRLGQRRSRARGHAPAWRDGRARGAPPQRWPRSTRAGCSVLRLAFREPPVPVSLPLLVRPSTRRGIWSSARHQRGNVRCPWWIGKGTAFVCGQRSWEAALEWGRFPNMRAWGAMLDGPERDLLERHGFRPPVRSPDRPPPSHASTVLVRSFGATRPGAWTLAGRRLLHLASWDLRLIYSDGV